MYVFVHAEIHVHCDQEEETLILWLASVNSFDADVNKSQRTCRIFHAEELVLTHFVQAA